MDITSIELRGRDLAIIPPVEWQERTQYHLFTRLFGRYLSPTVLARIEQDTRGQFLRTQPSNFNAIKQALIQQKTPFHLGFTERPRLPFVTKLGMEPRPYQRDAVTAWRVASSAGVVVLPTGAGKTFVAAMAIHETGTWTLAVVPTIDLLQQWRIALATALTLDIEDIGIFGGGEKEIKPITIITYDSAVIYPHELRNFGLLIFDELCVIEEC